MHEPWETDVSPVRRSFLRTSNKSSERMICGMGDDSVG